MRERSHSCQSHDNTDRNIAMINFNPSHKCINTQTQGCMAMAASYTLYAEVPLSTVVLCQPEFLRFHGQRSDSLFTVGAGVRGSIKDISGIQFSLSGSELWRVKCAFQKIQKI